MNPSSKGQTVVETTREVSDSHLASVAAAIATETGSDTARLVPWFGPTASGEQRLLDVLDLDLSRALLAGQSYSWTRPFNAGETVSLKVVVDDVYEKGNNTFGIVKTEIRDSAGELVQEQRTTFIERGAA